MTTCLRTPLAGEDIRHLIEHVNQDHTQDLLYCLQAFTPSDQPTGATLTALYADGADVTAHAPGRATTHFLAFPDAASPQDALRALASEARKKLGVDAPKRQATWTVHANEPWAGAYRRLTLNLGTDRWETWQPGDCARFMFTADEGRPYTLRRLTGQRAVIDVFTHDATAGSVWASRLQPGDEVQVEGEWHEQFPDFTAGEVVLFGDETSLPTLAGLLDRGGFTSSVTVLVELTDLQLATYLDDVPAREQVQVTWVRREGPPGEASARALRQLGVTPAAVWGVSSVSGARLLKRELKAEYPEAEVRVKAYWRDPERHADTDASKV